MKKSDLPISPHLQIYKPQINSILSITHRVTGFCLNLILVLLSLWTLSIALGEDYYIFFIQVYDMLITKLVISIGLFGFFYHALNGIRHIFWDFGFFINNLSSLISGYIVLAFTMFLSILAIFKLGIF